ncbi:hypothetical protein JCM10296v2_007936 [Rhodotorula toruloides]
MLPIPAASSPRSSTPVIPPAAAKRTLSSLPAPIRRLFSHPLVLRARTYRQQHPKRTSSLAALLALSLVYLVFLRGDSDPYNHAPLAWGTHPDAIVNWGDYVGLGHQRQKVYDATPKGYADIGDKFPDLDKALGGGPLYRKRRSREEKERGVGTQDLKEGGKGRNSFERHRHGVLGGASVEWSTGVVGSGTYLGPGVDMRKDGSYAIDVVEEDEVDRPASSSAAMSFQRPSPAQHALSQHILEKGWVYLDEEDRLNTEKLQLEAKEKRFFDKLPLRERVRGDPQGQREAAEGWARVYAAMEEPRRPKSALEVQVEKMVRRVPVVVFSKTTCPFSKRAKERLEELQLFPSAHIVEVDLRPDVIALKALLARRTNHSTWPNIIIGSRSIGGADDLDRLLESGELGEMLEEVGVRWQKP